MATAHSDVLARATCREESSAAPAAMEVEEAAAISNQEQTEHELDFGEEFQGLWELCDCDAHALSVESLREAMMALPKVSSEEFNDSAECMSLLHAVCGNWHGVKLEIVQEILEFIPNAAQITPEQWDYYPERFPERHGTKNPSYPLHVACRNSNCPLSVIELLIEKNPGALGKMGLYCAGEDTGIPYDLEWIQLSFSFAEGTPLHYYLSRESNLTIEGVELLVKAYPEALQMRDKIKQTNPLHTIAVHPKLGDHVDAVKFLIDSDPTMLQMFDSCDATDSGASDEDGFTPFHLACRNGGVSLPIVKLLYESRPEGNNKRDWYGRLALHNICENAELEDATALEILEYITQIDLAQTRNTQSQVLLPIHLAAGQGRRNRKFCEILVNMYPESVTTGCLNGHWPIHYACAHGKVDTLRFFYELNPASLNVENLRGYFPIHEAAFNGSNMPATIDYLVSVDPDCLSKRVGSGRLDSSRFEGNLPLHCIVDLGNRSWKADLNVKYLFDKFPEAILEKNNRLGKTPLDIARTKQSYYEKMQAKIVKFLEDQFKYASKVNEMTLHRAICDQSVSLGVIKMIIANSPTSISLKNSRGILPIHLACQHSSHDVVQFLIESDDKTTADNAMDANGNNLLHHACQSGNASVVIHLAKTFPSMVSSVNEDGILPFHLLASLEEGSNGVAYTDAMYHLLLAHPEVVASAINRSASTEKEEPNCSKRKRTE